MSQHRNRHAWKERLPTRLSKGKVNAERTEETPKPAPPPPLPPRYWVQLTYQGHADTPEEAVSMALAAVKDGSIHVEVGDPTDQVVLDDVLQGVAINRRDTV
jgi:hypothetical protein